MTTTPTLIAPAELQALMATEATVVIDTRDADTYAAGHVPGAVNMREIFTYLATSTAEGIAALKSTFAKAFGEAGLTGEQTAVFYEDALNSGYGQSCRGYYLLTWLGMFGRRAQALAQCPCHLPIERRASAQNPHGCW